MIKRSGKLAVAACGVGRGGGGTVITGPIGVVGAPHGGMLGGSAKAGLGKRDAGHRQQFPKQLIGFSSVVYDGVGANTRVPVGSIRGTWMQEQPQAVASPRAANSTSDCRIGRFASM